MLWLLGVVMTWVGTEYFFYKDENDENVYSVKTKGGLTFEFTACQMLRDSCGVLGQLVHKCSVNDIDLNGVRSPRLTV